MFLFSICAPFNDFISVATSLTFIVHTLLTENYMWQVLRCQLGVIMQSTPRPRTQFVLTLTGSGCTPQLGGAGPALSVRIQIFKSKSVEPFHGAWQLHQTRLLG